MSKVKPYELLVEGFIKHDSLKQKTISSETIFSKQSKSPF